MEVPALPGCYTQGETKEEAVSMAKEAIELYLESCQAHNEVIPQESGIESLTVAVREPVAQTKTLREAVAAWLKNNHTELT